MTNFTKLQRDAWLIAENHGFHGDPEEGRDERSNAEILALIHSEVSEALEVDRDPDGTKEEYAEELADIVIRVMDHAESEEINLERNIKEKHEKNRKRDFKHGKEY